MAEGDITFYNLFKKKLFDNDVDFLADTMKVALVTAYTPNIDTHEFWGDAGVSSTEESGTGYVAGGETLGTKATTVNTTTDLVEVDAADVTWTGLDVGTPSHAIIYKDTGTPATSPLMCYMEITTASNGGDYTIQWSTSPAAICTLA